MIAALDEIAQQISEGRSITLVDSATTHPGAGAAAPLAAWLAQRADELRAADDAQVLDDICRRDASTTPTTAEVDATAATTAEAPWAEIVGEAPTEGQAPDTPSTPHSPEDAPHADRPPPTVDVIAAPAPSELRVVFLAVTHHSNPNGRGARLMVCLPPRRNALYGVTEATDAPRRRREATCNEAIRTVVITTGLRRLPPGAILADAPPAITRTAPATAEGAWWTLEQLAGVCTDPPASLATARARRPSPRWTRTCSPRATHRTPCDGACEQRRRPTTPRRQPETRTNSSSSPKMTT